MKVFPTTLRSEISVNIKIECYEFIEINDSRVTVKLFFRTDDKLFGR